MKQLVGWLKSNKTIIVVDQVMVSGANFITAILLARLLGIEIYGVFALLWMVVLFALSLHQALITKPLLSFAPVKKNDEQKQYYANLEFGQWVFFASLNGLALLLVTGANTWQYQLPYENYILPITAIASCFLLHDFYRKVFFVQQNSIISLVADALLYVGQMLVYAVAWGFFEIQLMHVLYTVLILNGLSVLWLMGCFSMYRIKVKNGKNTIQEHYHFSKWLGGTAILQWLSGNYFIIAAAAIIGPASTGAVRIAQNLVGLCHILFLAMETIVPIAAAKAYTEGGYPHLILYLKGVGAKVGLVVASVLLVLATTAPWLINQMYGNEFVPYSYVVVGYCLLYVLVFVGIMYSFILRTLNNTKPIFVAYVFSALFSVATAYAMVNKWGLVGLMAGLILAQLISVGVYQYYVYQAAKN